MGRHKVNVVSVELRHGCRAQCLRGMLLSKQRPRMMPRFVDLFCGIGSFHLALSEAGCRCIMACDISKHAQSFYVENYSMAPLGDIAEIDPHHLEDFEILCAGFPCQSFSTMGNRKGFADEANGGMFSELMRFVVAKCPQVVLLENVEGLLKQDNGHAIKYIVSTLTNLCYSVNYKLLCCSDFGIPQMRKRVFLVGLHKTVATLSPLENIFDMDRLKCSCSLSKFLKVPLVKHCANTIRIGGHQGLLLERSWSRYVMTDGEVYELTLEEGIRLQGFEGMTFRDTCNQIWKLLGNTIPTVFTRVLALKLFEIVDVNTLRSKSCYDRKAGLRVQHPILTSNDDCPIVAEKNPADQATCIPMSELSTDKVKWLVAASTAESISKAVRCIKTFSDFAEDGM